MTLKDTMLIILLAPVVLLLMPVVILVEGRRPRIEKDLAG